MIGNADNVITTILSNAVRAATVNGPDVNVAEYKGIGQMIIMGAAQGSGITSTVKLQNSDIAARGAAMITAGDADLKLNLATSGKTKQAITFTQSGARSIKTVALKLKNVGTITAGKLLTLTIETDSTGAPDGTPLGTAGTVLCSAVPTAYGYVTFTFAAPVDLTDTGVYWLVLTSDYTASDSNYISWSVLTVASGGTVSGFATPTWTPVTTQKALFYIDEYSFSDVPGAAFTAVGNVAAVEGKLLDLDALKSVVRTVDTVAGGSATGALGVIMIGVQ